MKRIGTPLGGAYIEDAAASIAFKEYDFSSCEQHLNAAFELFKQANALGLDEAISNRSLLAVIYVALGRSPDSAIVFAQQAVDLATLYHAACSKPIAYANLTLGLTLYMKEDMASSIRAYQQAYQIFAEILPPRHPHIVTVNTNLAEMHAEMNHPTQALYFSGVAIENCRDQDIYQQAEAYYRHGKVLAQLDLPVQARYYLAKARDIYRNSLPEHRLQEINTVVTMLGSLVTMGDVVGAGKMLDTLAALNASKDDLSDFTEVNFLEQQGIVYRLQGLDAESLHTYQQMLALVKQKLDISTYRYRSTYQQLGLSFLAAGQLDSAQHYYCLAEPYILEEGQEALDWVIDFRLLGIEIATQRADYQGAAQQLLSLLNRYASASTQDKVQPMLFQVVTAAQLLYAAAPDWQTRELFLRSVRASDHLLTVNYSLLAAERWTPSFIDDLRNIYTDAAFAAAEQCAASAAAPAGGYWCTLAVRYADLPRALALRRRGAELAAGLRAGIPDSLVERGQYLQRRQASLRHSEMDSSRRVEELAALRETTAEYETELRFRYPQYYQSVLSPLALDVAALRRQASAEDALYVSYLVDSVAQRMLVCAVDGSGKDEIRVVAHGPAQIAMITGLKAELARQGSERLVELGYGLYEQYVAPVLPKGDRKQAIIIASDGDLAGLPFAALLTDTPTPGAKMSAWPWLGLRYRVSYTDALASAQQPAAAKTRARSRGSNALEITCVAPGFEEAAGPSRAISTGLGTGASEQMMRTPWTLALGKLLGERYGATVLTARAPPSERS